jgi:SMODS and SLOG-associating 2TM effector domain 1
MSERRSVAVSNDRSGLVAFTIRVGVTGHRDVTENGNMLSALRIEEALNSVRTALRRSDSRNQETEIRMCVVSALAEGTDRLVARAVLDQAGDGKSLLEVILPTPKDSYMKDFKTQQSREEFLRLLGEATWTTCGNLDTAAHGYEWASREMVDRADILLAVWDGRPSRGAGGTADTVRYALETRTPVVWLSTQDGNIRLDSGRGRVAPAFSEAQANRTAGPHNGPTPLERIRDIVEKLDRYNSIPTILGRECRDLAGSEALEGTEVDPNEIIEGRFSGRDEMSEVIRFIDPLYVWADRRSLFFQRWYKRGIELLFVTTFISVLVAAGVVAFGLPRKLFLCEAGLLTVALVVVGTGRRLDMHDQWLDCRFIAERLRSFVFLKAAEVTERRKSGSFEFDLASDSWVQFVVSEVWTECPIVEQPVPTEVLRELLVETWTRPQIDYYRRSSERHRTQQHRVISFSVGLLCLTIVLALWHSLGSDSDIRGLNFVAISLPALGSTVAGISAQRQHQRHASIYARMATTLAGVQRRLIAAETPNDLQNLVWAAENAIRAENRDWGGVMRFHDFEVAGS